jgi:hypothetical protein
MSVETEGRHAGEFLLSENNRTISRKNVTIASGENVVAGQVLGKITATGKYAAYDNGAGDGTQAAAGIALDNYDASSADVEGVAIVRDAEVIKEALTYLTSADESAAITDLEALGISVRD